MTVRSYHIKRIKKITSKKISHLSYQRLILNLIPPTPILHLFIFTEILWKEI